MSSTTHSNPVVHLGSNSPIRSVPTSHQVMAFWEVVTAVTGIVLVGFVIGHMWGNLKMFSGPDEINAYSRFLRDVGMPELAYGQLLWAVRIILLMCVALHITAAYQLTRMSWAARPVGYNGQIVRMTLPNGRSSVR